MSLPAGIRLIAKAPNGSLVDYSNYDGLDLTISDTCPGGYDRASFTICNPNHDIPMLFTKVYVEDTVNKKLAWLGRTLEPKISYPSGPAKIDCVGYNDSLEDNGFEQSMVFPAGSSFATMVSLAITQLCPELAQGGISFGGGSSLNIAEDSQDYGLQTAKTVIENLIALTAAFATPLLYYVWEDDTVPLSTVPKLYFSAQDMAARFDITLKDPGVTCESTYDGHGIINKGVVQYGNQQFTSYPPTIDYTNIPIVRSKRLNAENDVRLQGTAASMANSFVSRFNILRALSDTITICKDEPIRAHPPVVTVITDNYPLHLVRSGYALNIMNIDPKYSPYVHRIKFIVSKSYSFTTGQLDLTCGETINVGTAIRSLQSTLTSRPFLTNAYSAQSYAMVDNDVAPVFGPAFRPDTNFSSGMPVFIKDKNAAQKAVIHPDLIDDRGLESNITIGNLALGPKGGIRTVPGLYKSWDAYLDNDNISDTITVSVFKKAAVPSTSTLQFLFNVKISNNSHGSGTIDPNINMLAGDRFFFEVIAEPTSAVICSISLFGPKTHPGLKL